MCRKSVENRFRIFFLRFAKLLESAVSYFNCFNLLFFTMKFIIGTVVSL